MIGQAERQKEFALLLLLATLWGASYTFIKIGVETIPPITFIALRTLIAGGILLAVMRVRKLRMPRDGLVWRRFFMQACLNSVVPFTLIAWAEQRTNAGLATILNSTSPIFTVLIMAVFVRNEAIGWQRSLGVLAGLIGTCLIVGTDAMNTLGAEFLGEVAIVAATICYAFAAIYGKGFKGLDPIMPAAGSLLCGAAILIPASLVLEHPWTIEPSARSLLALGCLAIFSTALALLIYFRLLQTLGSVGTTAQAYLRVPIGVAIGVLCLGETLTSTASAGLGFVILGVFAMTASSRNTAAA